MAILLVLSSEDSFFTYCVHAFSPHALECRIIWDKADKETEELKVSVAPEVISDKMSIFCAKVVGLPSRHKVYDKGKKLLNKF